MVFKKAGLTRDSFVVEIASNDGSLLRNFIERGIPVLGIDPAEGPARAAEHFRTRNSPQPVFISPAF